VDPDELKRQVSKIAAAALLIQNGWSDEHACKAAETGDLRLAENLPLGVSERVREWLGVPQIRTQQRRQSTPIGTPQIKERARKYVEKMPAAVSGSGGHAATWAVSLVLVKGFALGESDALDILSDYNTRCDPPWTERELLHKLSDASRSRADSGWLLESDADYRTYVAKAPVPAPVAITENAISVVEVPASDPPIPFDEFDLPTFPTKAFPQWLKDFVEAEAEATQTPVDLASMLALSVCSAGLSKKFVVEGSPGWLEPVNLYTVTALPPASRKTSVFSSMISPITAFEVAEYERTRVQIAMAEQEKRMAEKSRAMAEDKALKSQGSEREHWSMEARNLEETLSNMNVPSTPRFVADDVTPEKLAVIMSEQRGRIAILSDEGGPFEMMAGRYSEKPNFEIYLKGHPGVDVRIDRKNGTSIHIRKPAITIGLAVQPDVLTGLASTPQLRGRGMLARILWSMPKSNIGSRSTRPKSMPDFVRADYHRHIKTLFELQPKRDEQGEWIPAIAKFSPGAQEIFDAFRQELEPKLSRYGELGYLQDWAGKLAGAILRIVWILSINRHFKDPSIYMGENDILAALEIGQYLIAHAKAAFSCMGADERTESAKHILGYIQRAGWKEFSRRDLHQVARGDARFKDPDSLDEPLGILEKRFFIRAIQTTSEGPGRRPSTRYRTNTQNSLDTQNSPGLVSANTNNGVSG
jgi:replicative DNA helicase